MKQNLYNDPFDHERYERDNDWIKTAIVILLGLSVCAIIYYVGVVVMG